MGSRGTPGRISSARRREAAETPDAATTAWPARASEAARTGPTRPAPTTPTASRAGRVPSGARETAPAWGPEGAPGGTCDAITLSVPVLDGVPDVLVEQDSGYPGRTRGHAAPATPGTTSQYRCRSRVAPDMREYGPRVRTWHAAMDSALYD